MSPILTSPKPIAAHHSPTNSLSSSISLVSPPLSFVDPYYDDWSDERIVWSGSNSAVLNSSRALGSVIGDDDDFVLLSPSGLDTPAKTSGNAHRRLSSSVSSSSSVESLIPNMKALSMDPPAAGAANQPKSRRNRHRANPEPNAPPPSKPAKKPAKTSNARSASPRSPPAQKKSLTPPVKSAVKSLGLGERPIVDDVSEYSTESSFYDNAVQLMGSVLASQNPSSSFSRLAILQALIVELGLVDSEVALPTTLTSAKALVRSNVFVNIRDYVATREQGQEALQQIMHKNRSSLIRDLRKKKNQRAPLSWVKYSGLSVLLVSCY